MSETKLNANQTSITASDIGALPTDGGNLNGNIVMGGNSILFGNESASSGAGIVMSSSGLQIGYYTSGKTTHVSPLWTISPGTGDLFPVGNGSVYTYRIGKSSNKVGLIYTTNLNNGNNIAVPTTGGTMVVADYTSASSGDVLSIDSSGNTVWASPSVGDIDCGVLVPPIANLTIRVQGDKANAINTFTINNHTYTIEDFTVVHVPPEYTSTLEIVVPTNTDLPWEMTSSTSKADPYPSSGTLNLTEDYTLNIIFMT